MAKVAILLYRQLLNWEWYMDSNIVHLFIHLLLKATDREHNSKGVILERGQLLTTLKELSQETGMSEQTIRTALKKLNLTDNITTKLTNRNRILTICKYDSYQPKKKTSVDQTNRQTLTKLTDKKEPEKLHPMQEWVSKNNLTNVMALEQQLTFAQCDGLIKRFKNKQIIKDSLLAMDNHKPLKSKYTSVYKTAINWCENRLKGNDKNQLFS